MKQHTTNLEWLKQLFIGTDYASDCYETSKHVAIDDMDKEEAKGEK